jgi:hypothetical protein
VLSTWSIKLTLDIDQQLAACKARIIMLEEQNQEYENTINLLHKRLRQEAISDKVENTQNTKTCDISCMNDIKMRAANCWSISSVCFFLVFLSFVAFVEPLASLSSEICLLSSVLIASFCTMNLSVVSSLSFIIWFSNVKCELIFSFICCIGIVYMVYKELKKTRKKQTLDIDQQLAACKARISMLEEQNREYENTINLSYFVRRYRVYKYKYPLCLAPIHNVSSHHPLFYIMYKCIP